ncbi:hypothetical protein NDA16_004603 [Ustilago loliicola]|nr:hypothetical protein NDA16_004603 [Ustilago loliicola]
MFSTLHIYLALVWIGLPAATISTLIALASRHYNKSDRAREHLKATILLLLVATVAWRTCTNSSRRGLSDLALLPLPSNQTVFVAINLYNSEHLFPAFSDSLLQLAHHLGEDNVYFSIYESNSKDRTKQHLSQLQHDFDNRGIQNRVRMLDNTRREDLERIHRLAIIRNEALSPLGQGIHGLHNRTFSKLIWLNDIFFRPGINATTVPDLDDGPIRFRTHPECLMSECLLPSYDIHIRSKQRPLIFVNPKAVATYQYRDYLMYDVIMRSNIVNLWSRIWQDLISHSLFGFFAEMGRKEDTCADTLRSGWKTA